MTGKRPTYSAFIGRCGARSPPPRSGRNTVRHRLRPVPHPRETGDRARLCRCRSARAAKPHLPSPRGRYRRATQTKTLRACMQSPNVFQYLPLPEGMTMTEQDQDDDRTVYESVDMVIGTLLSLAQSSRLRVYRTVGTFFGFDDSYPKVDKNTDNRVLSNISREPQFSSLQELTPKDFLLQKKPNTNVERVACLAYYLAHYRDTQQFKTIEINKLNTEAAQPKLPNASYTIRDAAKSGYLTEAAKGMKQLSAQGELYVEALPDRSAAKEVKPQIPKRARRRIRMNQAESNHDQEPVDSDE